MDFVNYYLFYFDVVYIFKKNTHCCEPLTGMGRVNSGFFIAVCSQSPLPGTVLHLVMGVGPALTSPGLT